MCALEVVLSALLVRKRLLIGSLELAESSSIWCLDNGSFATTDRDVIVASDWLPTTQDVATSSKYPMHPLEHWLEESSTSICVVTVLATGALHAYDVSHSQRR